LITRQFGLNSQSAACPISADGPLHLTSCTLPAKQGRRYVVIVQVNELLPRSVVLIAPTSHSARAASFRPEIDLLGETTRVFVEQIGALDASRLGDLVGRVSPEQQWGIDEALLTVLGLR
jgi:mRNA interferase MazF